MRSEKKAKRIDLRSNQEVQTPLSKNQSQKEYTQEAVFHVTEKPYQIHNQQSSMHVYVVLVFFEINKPTEQPLV